MSNPHDPYRGNGGNGDDGMDDRTRQFSPVDPPTGGSSGYPAPRNPRDWEQAPRTGNGGYADYSQGQQGYADEPGQGDTPVTHYEKVNAELNEALNEVDKLRTYRSVALIAAPAALLLGLVTVFLLMSEPKPAETVVTGVDGQPTTTMPAETTTATRTVENEVTETQTATQTDVLTETATETVTQTPDPMTTTVTTTVPTTE